MSHNLMVKCKRHVSLCFRMRRGDAKIKIFFLFHVCLMFVETDSHNGTINQGLYSYMRDPL